MIALPDTSTEVALATTTLSSAAATITFSSISSSYTDLRLVLVGSVSAIGQVGMRFNSDSSSLYSGVEIRADGSTAGSDRDNNDTAAYFNYSTLFGTSQPFFASADIMSYAGSTNKTSLLTVNHDRNGSGFIERGVWLYRSTTAISSITIITTGPNLTSGTTATLYGIL